MKIAVDADADFFNIHGNSTNAQMLSAINEIEGLYAYTFNIAFQVTNIHYYQSASVSGYPYTANISDGGNILAYIIHSGFISGYQNRYGDNLKPPTNVYHRMTA